MKTEPIANPAQGSLAETPPAQPKGAGLGRMFFGLLAVVAAVLGWCVWHGISNRVAASTALAAESKENSALLVLVVHPKPGSPIQELVLPGNTQALAEAPIYARTSGYLKTWTADIGTRVKAGQLLAQIETPELDQQLEQARADLETAKANLALSDLTAERLTRLQNQDAVAKQDVDNAVGDRNSKRSVVNSQTANVHRLETMQNYERVLAPFDGVITARNTEVGTLIDATGSGKELFHLAAINRLRIFINIPEESEQSARTGASATLALAEFPGRRFHGTIVRNANAIDPASHTLLVEVDVDNPTGELLPGAYATVHIPLSGRTLTAVTVPANTLLFRAEGLRAAVVRDDVAVLLPIQVGRDFGDSLEVVSGLHADDMLILNPPDSLVNGTSVRVTK